MDCGTGLACRVVAPGLFSQSVVSHDPPLSEVLIRDWVDSWPVWTITL